MIRINTRSRINIDISNDTGLIWVLCTLKKSFYIVFFVITYIPFQSRFLEYLIPQHGSNLSLNGYIVFIYLFALLLMLPQSFYEVMCETTRLEYFNIKIGCLGRCAYRLFTQHLQNISIDIFVSLHGAMHILYSYVESHQQHCPLSFK